MTTATPETAPTPTELSAYPFRCEERVRFGDLDPLGHVNNAAVATYFESARVALFEAVAGRLGSGGRSVVLAHIAIDYRAELTYPGTLMVGARVARIGRTSVTLDSAVFRGSECAAASRAVCVMVDTAARRPVPVDDALRAALQRFG